LALNPATGNDRWFTDGEEHYRGLEMSVTGYVREDLALYATATTLKARYEDNPGLSGFRTEGTPKNTWSVAGEYTMSWLNPGLKITAGAYHVGRQAINATNNAFTDSYTTFDLGGSYTFELANYEVVMRVNGQNITNEDYWASTGFRTLALGLPRVVKFSVSINY
jgi:iron complex outermembrane receptor protein